MREPKIGLTLPVSCVITDKKDSMVVAEKHNKDADAAQTSRSQPNPSLLNYKSVSVNKKSCKSSQGVQEDKDK
jgi:hypothetical protein